MFELSGGTTIFFSGKVTTIRARPETSDTRSLISFFALQEKEKKVFHEALQSSLACCRIISLKEMFRGVLSHCFHVKLRQLQLCKELLISLCCVWLFPSFFGKKFSRFLFEVGKYSPPPLKTREGTLNKYHFSVSVPVNISVMFALEQ